MVRGEQKIGIERSKNTLAFTPRRRFDARRVAARNLHTVNGQLNGMGRAPFHAKTRPGVGVRRQAVVNVNRTQMKRVLHAQRQQRVQQNDRIHPARQRQRQPRVRRYVACEASRQHAGDSLIWQGLP